MTSDQDLEKTVYYEALAIEDADRRQIYLDAVCGRDAELMQRVQALLDDADAGSFLQSSPLASAIESIGATKEATVSEPTGMTIGPYRLLEKIGEGGFGVVYMADQLRPLQRRVAVKIIKPGMDTEQVIARFEAERQALALMDHPNVAKVFDAGSTENGRPYFAMELVKGIPVTEYCDDRGLSTAQRLQLFVTICSAVQHAHQKGIIHRDIKPNNILVTTNGDKPVPKVIDFGVAKATQGRLTDKTLFTHFRQFIGTPAYMSPEQAQMSAVDVDTRSDVYSLGVLLYELLTGKTPLDSHELQKAGFEELCRRIREDEAPKPSVRLSSLSQDEISSVSRNRSIEPSHLPAEVRGDLDWIVMKAVEKDRTRRYATAESLAQDIHRHLNREPVTAVPPSARYLLSKFARRNRRLLATMALIGGILLSATGVSSWLAVRLAGEVADKNKAMAFALDAKKSAENAEREASKLGYISDLNSASMAVQLDSLGIARSFLERIQNRKYDADFPGWELAALQQQCRGDASLRFGTQHDIVNSICVIPDRPLLVTGSDRGSVRVWNHLTGELLKTLFEENGQARIRGVKLDSKRERLFAVSMDGVFWVWELPSFAATQHRLEFGDADSVHDFVANFDVSPDGRMLAVTDANRLTVWTLSSNAKTKLIKSLEVDATDFNVRFSPDGGHILIGANSWIRVVSSANWEDVTTLSQGGNFAMKFSPDGSLMAVSPRFTSRHIDLYEVDGWRHIGKLRGHTGIIWDVAFSPDGKRLASASADTTIRIWNVETLEQNDKLLGHNTEIWAVEFDPAAGRLYGGGKGEICVFDSQRTESTWPITKNIVPGDWHRRYSQASFSHDGKWIATCNSQPENRVTASLRSAETLEEVVSLPSVGDNVRGVRFSPVDSLLAIGDRTGTLMLLDANMPEHVSRISLAADGEVAPVEFSKDGGRLLVVIQKPGEAQYVIWSVPESRSICTWDIPGLDKCAMISPNGESVVTGHPDGSVRVWNANDGSELSRHEFRSGIFAVAYSCDGEQIAFGGDGGLLRLLDATNGHITTLAQTSNTTHHSIDFSHDGRLIVTGSGDPANAMKVWDVAARRELVTLPTRGYSFRQVEFSPDGNSVFLIGGRDYLKLWRPPQSSGRPTR